MPFDYDSLKCILFRLDSNKRLELFERYPSIRTADRAVPIKLEEFKFGSSFVQINERKYQLGIIRHYENTTTPEWVRKENADGGVKFDVGAFARPRNHLVAKEMTQRKLRDRKPSLQEMIKNGEDEQKLKELLFESKKHDNCSSQKVLELEIKRLQVDIRNHKEQKAISELKYTNYILLTKPSVSHQHELVCYAFPLQHYLDYLTQFLFGRRTILLDNFKYIYTNARNWPENVTIRIQRYFEVQWKDSEIYTIEIPSKKICFRIANLLELEISRNLEKSTFEVKEAKLDETIGSLLELFGSLIPEKARTQLIKKQLPLHVEHSSTARDIFICVEKIRNGKMPITRGDYRVEWVKREHSTNLSNDQRGPNRGQVYAQHNFLPPNLIPL